MWVRPGFVVLTLALAVSTACGTSPTSPGAPASGPPAALRIVGDGVIDFTQGESRPLTIEEFSGAAYVARPATNYAWTSSDTAVASVSASGVVTTGTGLGQALITATAADGQTAVARLWIQLPESVPSTFRITLLFSENFPEDWKPHFEWASARWEQVIRAPLPAAALVNPPSNVCGNTAGAPPIPTLTGTTTGSVILVERSTTNGGAFGGPCTHRPLPSPTTIRTRHHRAGVRRRGTGESRSRPSRDRPRARFGWPHPGPAASLVRLPHRSLLGTIRARGTSPSVRHFAGVPQHARRALDLRARCHERQLTPDHARHNRLADGPELPGGVVLRRLTVNGLAASAAAESSFVAEPEDTPKL